jgi:hypothetical protein
VWSNGPKICEFPEDGQQLRPKHVGVIINKNIVQDVGVKCCEHNIAVWKM